jgi:hypothetical protein
MATPGQEMMACQEEEGMGKDAVSFAVIVIVVGNGLIQASQGQWRLIAVQGCGAQWPKPIKQ